MRGIESVLEMARVGTKKSWCRRSSPLSLLWRRRVFVAQWGPFLHLLCTLSLSLSETQSLFLIKIRMDISDVASIEYPTLKVPYEILNKKFRSAQKVIDREVSSTNTLLNDLEDSVRATDSLDSASGDSISVATISGLISGVIDKLTAFKRKATESLSDEIEAANSCKRRLDHVKEYAPKANSTAPADVASVNKWKRIRLNRMLVEHFLRCGYYESAIKLARHCGIEHLTNIELFLVSREVEESLRKRDTAKCLNWCHDNRSRLRKLHSNLEFNLRQQEFIELVRAGQFMDAVVHSRKYLSNCEEMQLKELPRVMGLVMCRPLKETMSRYKCLFDETRWDVLIEQFRQENFKLFQLSSTSVFSVTLQAGLSSLKTPQCYRHDGVKVADCPVCSDLMNALAHSLPCAHCSQSRLVCAISGMPLNEHNQPLMLPNGNVYGSVSLNQMAAQRKGRVTCPRSNREFDIEEAQKVFVM